MDGELIIKKMDLQIGDDKSVTATFALGNGSKLVLTVTMEEIAVRMLTKRKSIFDASNEDAANAGVELLIEKFTDTYNALHGGQS